MTSDDNDGMRSQTKINELRKQAIEEVEQIKHVRARAIEDRQEAMENAR